MSRKVKGSALKQNQALNLLHQRHHRGLGGDDDAVNEYKGL